jgi:hypothetical protein
MRYISLHFGTQPATNLSPEKQKQPKTQRTEFAPRKNNEDTIYN